MNITYSLKIFKKPIDQLDLNDVIYYFQEKRRESEILEFKSGDTLINDVAREITAFLNTKGGIIIVGAPRELKDKNNKRFCYGELTKSTFKNANWILNEVNQIIVPAANEIIIKELKDEQQRVYVIEVPRSTNKPHQCLNDGRYYIRIKDVNQPAPHALIQELFFQRMNANLNIDLHIKHNKETPANIIKLSTQIKNPTNFAIDDLFFQIHLVNISEIIYSSNNVITEKLSENNFIYKNKNADHVVSDIYKKIEFEVRHLFKPFYLGITAYSKQCSASLIRMIYDPVNRKELIFYKTGDKQELSETQLIDELNKLLSGL